MGESTEIVEALDHGFVRITDMQPILGVTKQRCHQLAQRADFPEPAKLVGRRGTVAQVIR